MCWRACRLAFPSCLASEYVSLPVAFDVAIIFESLYLMMHVSLRARFIVDLQLERRWLSLKQGSAARPRFLQIERFRCPKVSKASTDEGRDILDCNSCEYPAGPSLFSLSPALNFQSLGDHGVARLLRPRRPGSALPDQVLPRQSLRFCEL